MWGHAGREHKANWNVKFCNKSWVLQKILGDYLKYKQRLTILIGLVSRVALTAACFWLSVSKQLAERERIYC